MQEKLLPYVEWVEAGAMIVGVETFRAFDDFDRSVGNRKNHDLPCGAEKDRGDDAAQCLAKTKQIGNHNDDGYRGEIVDDLPKKGREDVAKALLCATGPDLELCEKDRVDVLPCPEADDGCDGNNRTCAEDRVERFVLCGRKVAARRNEGVEIRHCACDSNTREACPDYFSGDTIAVHFGENIGKKVRDRISDDNGEKYVAKEFESFQRRENGKEKERDPEHRENGEVFVGVIGRLGGIGNEELLHRAVVIR